MKAIVTEVFIDKFDGTEYSTGTVIEVDADRCADLEARGLAKAIETVAESKAASKKKRTK